MKRRILLFGRPYPLFARYNSNCCLSWPLKHEEKLSTRLLDIENHWKSRLGNVEANKDDNRLSKYVLAMFPYPSGRLHIGHLRVYTISDVTSRFYSLNGFSTIHPIGWDAFGLPAENAAIERGIDPKLWTYENIETMREQLKMMGIQFDWNREIFTCKSEYYKWTQWIFLQLYQRGLVQRTLSEVFWDPIDQTVLADEQVGSDGRSWRSGAIAERRRLRHWVVETPKYAKRLRDGLDVLMPEWGEAARIQANWLGTCDVYRFLLPIENESDEKFDLRIQNPIDLLKAQFVIITDEHFLAVEYRRQHKDVDFDSLESYLLDEKIFNFLNGVQMPIVAILPAKIDGWPGKFFMDARLADPSANDVDFKLAEKFALRPAKLAEKLASTSEIQKNAECGGYGGYLTSRILRDWVVSRQRAWGTPIPMVLDAETKINAFPVAENQLPIRLEQRGQSIKDSRFTSGNGTFETDTLDTFVDSSWYYLRFLDPKNKNAMADPAILRAKLPVDVYVGGLEHADKHLVYARFISYFLHDMGILEDPEPFRRLIPQGIVKGRSFRLGDVYLRPEDVVEQSKGSAQFVEKKTGKSVVTKFEKMSKSKHNGVDPMELVAADGIDLARLQLIDAAAPRQDFNWGATQEADVKGLKRILDRCAAIVNTYIEGRTRFSSSDDPLAPNHADEAVEKHCRDFRNDFVRKVSVAVDITNMHNTAMHQLQIFARALKKVDAKAAGVSVEFEKAVHSLVIILQIFAPHIAAELWAALATVPEKLSPTIWKPEALVSAQEWPVIDADALTDFVVTIGGKILSCEEPRNLVEPMEVNELVDLVKNKFQPQLFPLLEENGIKITGFDVKKRPGLFVILDIRFTEKVKELLLMEILSKMDKTKSSAVKAHKVFGTKKKRSYVRNVADSNS